MGLRTPAGDRGIGGTGRLRWRLDTSAQVPRGACWPTRSRGRAGAPAGGPAPAPVH